MNSPNWFCLASGLATVVVATSTSLTSAAVVVSAPSVSLPQGTSSVVIPITISGGDQIDAITFDLRIGDGGPVAGGSDVVPITAFNNSLSIFKSTPTGDISTVDTLPSSSSLFINGTVTGDGESIAASGELFRITVNTSGLVQGQQFAINFVGLGVALDGNIISSSASPGQITITAVPEPVFMSGLAMTSLLALRRRRA